MRFELFNNTPDNSPWGYLFLWTLVWVATLARILTRRDLDTLNKLLWIIVVIFVPFFGVFLYCFTAPEDAAVKSKREKIGRIMPRSDVSGTPWANDAGYTKD